MGQVLPDLLKNNLDILFVGINPGLKSGEIGHHFASHSNRFWKFLNESGLTPSKLSAVQDGLLLDFNYGITNIVPRATATAAELSPDEFRHGAGILKNILVTYQPYIAAYLGKTIYRYLSESTDFAWGIQPQSVVEEVIDYVMPNPSGLNRIPLPQQLEYYSQLNGLKQKLIKNKN